MNLAPLDFVESNRIITFEVGANRDMITNVRHELGIGRGGPSKATLPKLRELLIEIQCLSHLYLESKHTKIQPPHQMIPFIWFS